MVRCCRWWVLRVPPTWLVICGILLVQVGFGLYPALIKKLASSADPIIFSLYRDLGGCPLLFLCAFVVERKVLFPRLKILLIFVMLGLTGVFGSQLLYILGVYWAGPDIASAFQPVIPVWTTVLAIATCTEKLPSPFHVHTWVKLLGILMAAGGAIELTFTTTANSSPDSNQGNSTSHHHHPVSLQLVGYVCLSLNTLLTASYLLIQKRFIFKAKEEKWMNSPIHVTAYSYFFGAFFMALASMYHVATHNYHKYLIPEQSIYALIYAIFIAATMCYMLITWSNMHLSTTVVTAFWPFQVLVAVIASYFFTGDKLAPLQYIGAVMLILALFLVLFSNHMEERLQEGKSVLRVDCRLTRSSVTSQPISDSSQEEEALLHSTVRVGELVNSIQYKTT